LARLISYTDDLPVIAPSINDRRISQSHQIEHFNLAYATSTRRQQILYRPLIARGPQNSIGHSSKLTNSFSRASWKIGIAECNERFLPAVGLVRLLGMAASHGFEP